MISQPTPIRQSKSKRPSGKRLSIRVDSDAYEAVQDLARDNERSVAGQIRFLLKRVAEDPSYWENQ